MPTLVINFYVSNWIGCGNFTNLGKSILVYINRPHRTYAYNAYYMQFVACLAASRSSNYINIGLKVACEFLIFNNT